MPEISIREIAAGPREMLCWRRHLAAHPCPGFAIRASFDLSGRLETSESREYDLFASVSLTTV